MLYLGEGRKMLWRARLPLFKNFNIGMAVSGIYSQGHLSFTKHILFLPH
jgi:hypothetical protein